MISILKQVRQEGFVAGWDAARGSMSGNTEAADYEGYERGRGESPSRFRWFCIGALTIALSFIPGWFV